MQGEKSITRRGLRLYFVWENVPWEFAKEFVCLLFSSPIKLNLYHLEVNLCFFAFNLVTFNVPSFPNHVNPACPGLDPGSHYPTNTQNATHPAQSLSSWNLLGPQHPAKSTDTHAYTHVLARALLILYFVLWIPLTFYPLFCIIPT